MDNNTENELKLFADDSGPMILPDDALISEEEFVKSLSEESMLISNSAAEAIEGKSVKQVLLPEKDTMIIPNYVIDISDIEDIEPIQIMGLNSLLDPKGETGIYIYCNGSIQEVGRGDTNELNRIITYAVDNVLGKQCKIYKNYQLGQEATVVSRKNITSLRLSL